MPGFFARRPAATVGGFSGRLRAVRAAWYGMPAGVAARKKPGFCWGLEPGRAKEAGRPGNESRRASAPRLQDAEIDTSIGRTGAKPANESRGRALIGGGKDRGPPGTTSPHAWRSLRPSLAISRPRHGS